MIKVTKIKRLTDDMKILRWRELTKQTEKVNTVGPDISDRDNPA